MHLVFGTRGIKRDVDEVVKFLETHPFYMPVITKAGKKVLQPIQGNLQPIQLWSYVFPENAKDAVLSSILKKQWTYPKDTKVKTVIKAIRRLMRLDNIPKFDEKAMGMTLPLEAMKNISIVPIGVKYDVLNWEDPSNGTIHERL